MIINDLSHVETVAEDKNIQGGLASATANAGAFANGVFFAGTNTSTFASASSTNFFFFSPNSASSSSSSSAGAQ